MSENVICRTNIILASTGAIEITIPVCHLGTKFGSLVCSLINRLRLCESYFNALIALLVRDSNGIGEPPQMQLIL